MKTPEGKLYSDMGRMLCQLHTVEEVITMVIWIIDSSLDKTVKPFEDYDRKTLGALMHLISKKVGIDDEFAKTFKRFLDSRNRFIHDFALTCRLGGDEDEKCRQEIGAFLKQLSADALKVKGVFLRYMLQAFSLHTDDAVESKIVASLRSKGIDAPDDLLNSLYGPPDNPLNIEFKE